MRPTSFMANEGGTLGVAFLIALPLLLLAAGLAIDLTYLNAQKRNVQALADLAALSGAQHLSTAPDARRAARDTVLSQSTYPVARLDDDAIFLGQRDGRAGFVPVSDQSDTAGVNAVGVVVNAPAQTFVLGMFMNASNFTIRRGAVATTGRSARVSFALSNCLLNLFLLRPILAPLIPTTVDVLCSGRGIDANVGVFPTLTDIATRAELLTPSGDDLSYGDILNADVPVGAVFEALTGQPVGFSSETIRLGDILYLPADLQDVMVGSPVPSLNLRVADVVLATAEVLGRRIVDLEVGVNLGPLANVRAAVRISDPRQIVVGAVPGDPEAVARTSQIELDFDEINILGIFALKLKVNLANATATLATGGNTCSMMPSAVVAVFDPVDATLLDVDMQIRVLGLPAQQQPLGVQVETVQTRETRRISFTRTMYDHAPVVRIGPTGQAVNDTLASSLRRGTSDLLGRAEADIRAERDNVRCIGLLGCVIGGTIAQLQRTLNTVLGTLVMTVANVANSIGAEGTLTNQILSGLVGLDIARADLELLQIECEQAGLARLIR